MWNRTENQITLVLIRHGETKSNREHRYLGRTDEALSMEGIRKLEQNHAAHKYPRVDMLFTSPMRRCLETASILYPDMCPAVIYEWAEMDFGAFEGKNYEELKWDERYQAWIDSDGVLPFPEGESREEFMLRCEEGFRNMLERINRERKQGRKLQTIGMLVHGGTIMALLSRLYGGEYFDYQVPNGEGYLCRITEAAEPVRIADVKRL